MAVVHLKDIEYSYKANTPILDIEEFKIEADDSTFLFGPSGCGKSTLLGLIAGILKPSKGELHILDTNFATATAIERDRVRAKYIGYIFQAFNLVPYLSVEENVALPAMFGRTHSLKFSDDSEEVRYLCDALGISQFMANPVSELSIGQQQRVAAARALFGSPKIILADEPTSALDTDSRSDFIKLLLDVAKSAQLSILFVSHDLSLASHFCHQVSLRSINRARQ
jgi:putative ABC transport system ATP-binding protein